jgi:hypothetical protein
MIEKFYFPHPLCMNFANMIRIIGTCWLINTGWTLSFNRIMKKCTIFMGREKPDLN